MSELAQNFQSNRAPLTGPPPSLSIERAENGWVVVGWLGGQRWAKVASTAGALHEIVDEWAAQSKRRHTDGRTGPHAAGYDEIAF